MKYDSYIDAVFVDRPNRFVAHVQVNHVICTVHVKNTGRCKELLLPGNHVILVPGKNKERKTLYDLVAVWKENLGWVNIDSQFPNHVVREWLEKKPEKFSDICLIQSEYAYGDSRIDFYLASDTRKVLMEVKGCTLERNRRGFFPDAPTLRGIKHLHELMRGVKEGYECYLAFVIAMPHVKEVFPNNETHAAFGDALNKAIECGVHVLFLACEVKENEMYIRDVIEKNDCYTG